MSGKNHAETFARLGVSKTGRYQGPPSAFTIPPPGHYLHDPHSPSKAPAWMVESIDKHGLIQDLVIKREGDKLMVDDGRTRVLAGLEVTEIRAARNPPEPPPMFGYKLLDGTEEAAERAMVIANTQRRVVGMATKAEMIADFRRRGFPASEVAARIAESARDLDKIAAVNDCAPKVRALMEAGRIDWRLAGVFSPLPREQQEAKVVEMIASGATRGAKAERIVRGDKRAARKVAQPIRGKLRARVVEALIPFAACRGAVSIIRFLDTGERSHLAEINQEMVKAIDAAVAPRKPGRKPAS